MLVDVPFPGDLLIAADSTKIGDTHGQWGLVPIWGMSVRLPERVGRSAALELMYTSRRITGAEAAGMGLVDRSVPDDELDMAVAYLAAEILRNSRGTNRIVKQLVSDTMANPRAQALEAERRRPYGTPEDMRERMQAGGR